MRKSCKKLIAFGLTAVLAVTSLSAGGLTEHVKSVRAASGGTGANREVTGSAVSGNSTAYVEVPDNPMPYHELSAAELIAEMGTGWNLGNTMDAHNNYAVNETAWQTVKTTKTLIKKVHDLGFNNIRIPVTWGNMINDDEDYSIDEIWMSRVQDIVDYAISENMYVTLNIHHDGAYNGDNSEHGWLSLDGSEEDYAKVKEKFAGVWNSISERFKNYDEHLIFESLNEVFETGYGWSDDADEVNRGLRKINELNQIFVNTVRATGSNNAKRWLSVPTVNTTIKTMIEDRFDFQVPTDTIEGRLMVAAHDYDSWSNATSVNENRSGSYAQQFKALKEKFVDNGIPVSIGEYGYTGIGRSVDRYEGINFLLKKYQIVGMVWDNGYSDGYMIIDRDMEDTYNKAITDAIMRGYYVTEDASGLSNNQQIVPLNSFDVSSTNISIKAGDSAVIDVSNLSPANSNDVILWKSNNGEIASVSNGKIMARAIGSAKITAFSQSGSFQKEITVTVTPRTLTEASAGIMTDYDAYELDKGGEAFINGKAVSSDPSAFVSYKSSDESVVSVSTMGKLLANKLGSAVVTVTTCDGLEKQIPVEVVKPAAPSEFKVRLALHVYYNDDANGYFGTELGSDIITVDKDGTYTLKFDCAKDLSDKAKEKNITSLNKLGSLYIKDYDVTSGEAKRSPNIAGKIRYNSIKVNGTELLDWETDNYDALKGMVFDSGNPLNAWDGSVIEDKITTDKEKFNIVFNDIAEPTQFEVKFTLSGFTGKVTQPEPKPSVQETPAADQPAPPAATATTTATPASVTDCPTPPAVTGGLKKGATQTVGGVKYTVINAKKKEVAYTSTVNKKLKKVTVKDSVKLKVNGKKVSYKITTISKNAFKGCKKLKEVVIGKNVTTIKTGAFNGCSKVKKITIKSTVLKKVEKNALKGIHAKCKVKVPKKKLSAYKKLLKGKGQKKTVKISA